MSSGTQRMRADFVVRKVVPLLDEVSMDAMLYLRNSQKVGDDLSEDLVLHLIKTHCTRHGLNLPNPSEFSASALRHLEAEIATYNAQIEEENSALDAVKLKKRS